MTTSINSLPEVNDDAALAKITDDPALAKRIAKHINGDVDFAFIPKHNATLRITGLRNDVLSIDLQGTACSGCPLAQQGTIRDIQDKLAGVFGTLDKVNIRVLPNVAGAKPTDLSRGPK